MTNGAEPIARHTVPLVAGLMLSIFLVALDGTIVSTAMPTIAAQLNGFSLYAWVPSVYLLTSAVSTPIYGKLADLFGRKHLLFFGIGLFLLGSVTSGAAQSMQQLILFRALQGLGAGAVMPVTTTIIGDIFTLEQRARMQGIFSSVWGISSVIGPLLGGTLVDSVGWRWIFYLNLPAGAVGVTLIAWYFHERPITRKHSLDILGATYLTTGLTALLLTLIEGGQAWAWMSAQTGFLIALTGVSLGLFIRQEQRTAEPVIPFSLFRVRLIAVSCLGMLFSGIVMISVSFEVPLYVQGVLGQDAIHAGLALAPMSIGWPLAGSFSGRLALRYGYRKTAVCGVLWEILGVALLLTLGIHSTFAEASVYSFLIGVGLGLSSTPMLIAVQSAVNWTRRGVATATTMFMRSFGAVVGLAIMGAIVNAATGAISSTDASQTLNVHAHNRLPPGVVAHVHAALLSGIHGAFLAALVAGIAGLVVAVILPGGSARQHELRDEGVEAAPSRVEPRMRPAGSPAPRTAPSEG